MRTYPVLTGFCFRGLYLPGLLSVLLVSHFSPNVVQAQLADANETTAMPGSLIGSVVSGEGRTPVRGAQVRIAESDFIAITDRFGHFDFTGIPAGRKELVINGDSTQTVRVTDVMIESGKQLELGSIFAEKRLSEAPRHETVVRAGQEVLALPAMVVEGFRAGRSRALQQKRQGANIVDIISADSIGNLPDRNVAEAVSRVPGVNIAPLDGPPDQPQGGEGRYVSIRGVDPNLNQVLLDGNTMSAPGGTRLGRAVPLDVLGATQIAQIEVIKSSTPDMDGNSLGGTINVKTASAFDRQDRFIQGSVSLNYNETAKETSPSVNLSYGDVFGERRQWGLALSVSGDKRSYAQERLVFGNPVANTVGATTFVLPNTLDFRPTWGYRLNSGLTANLEFRPSDNAHFYLRTSLNRSKTDQNWDEYRLDTGGTTNTITLTSPTSGIFSASRTQGQYRDLRQIRTQGLYNFSTGAKLVMENFIVEPGVSYSYAEENRDKLKQLVWQTTRGNMGEVEFELKPGDRYPSKWGGLGPRWTDPANYLLSSVRIDDGGIIEDETMTGRVDVRWNRKELLGGTGFFKVGVKAIRRSRLVDLVSLRLQRAGNWTLAAIDNAVLPGKDLYHGQYATGFSLDGSVIQDYLDRNPTLTTYNANSSASNSIEDDYDITEDIFAGYGMANIKFGRLTLLGGLRWERTEATIKAVENRTANGVNLGRFPVEGSTSYDSYFPNIQAIFRPTKQLVMRAAITQSVGRPAYEDARPLSTFSYNSMIPGSPRDPAYSYTGVLTIGNPDLKPYKGTNYDLSLEYYMKGDAMVSAALFRKDISDPIYGFNEVREMVTHSGIALEELDVRTRLNAESGQINGLELSVYLPFRFLPAPFDGAGIEANATFISSEVTINQRLGDKLPFFRQPDEIRNMTLFYEKNKFSARVSLSYTSAMLTELSPTLATDRWTDTFRRVDAQFRYRISRHYAVSLAVRNLTREQENYSYGKGGPLRETYRIGQNYTLSLNMNY